MSFKKGLIKNASRRESRHRIFLDMGVAHLWMWRLLCHHSEWQQGSIYRKMKILVMIIAIIQVCSNLKVT